MHRGFSFPNNLLQVAIVPKNLDIGNNFIHEDLLLSVQNADWLLFICQVRLNAQRLILNYMRRVRHIFPEHGCMKYWMNLRQFWGQGQLIGNFPSMHQNFKRSDVPRVEFSFLSKSHYTLGGRNFEEHMVTHLKMYYSPFLICIALLSALS